jgi:hypothetical protein
MTAGSLPGEAGYVDGSASYLVGLRPQDALATPLRRMLDILRSRCGEAVDVALSEAAVDLERPLADLPDAVRSPRASEPDSSWLKRSNMVGINVRTVGDYGGVVKYAMTLPAALDSIHLLPIWEPGVVASLYGMASFNLNTEFFSDELYEIARHLDTTERQLRAVSNLVHVMGKSIGLDVIPHTDRYSEPALGSPDLFEWMRVVDRQVVDHSDALVEEVERVVFAWLGEVGSADGALEVPSDLRELFSMDEATRLQLLFGEKSDVFNRNVRRGKLLMRLKERGLEPVPATMGVPFRGIAVDPDPTHMVVDGAGLEWPEYVFSEPGPFSRVFSPLARYKLYENRDNNANWEIDFTRPRHRAFEYVWRNYGRTRHIGNFDFMRGDMSHVQMRPDGVPHDVDEFYDVLGSVKLHIQRTHDAPWFGYFAETFLPPRDVFGYGEEQDHLEASLADATLGDLQSTVVGDQEFLRLFRRYLDDLATRRTAPAFTVMTADKDDPRFDEFYRAGNEARMFSAIFLTDMPSYIGLGFEIRDVHLEPVENERYTKPFVFKESGDSNVYPSKARFGNEFIWGENDELFDTLTDVRQLAERILPDIATARTRWLIPPDATTLRGTAVWTQDGEPRYVFAVNYDLEKASGYFGIPGLAPAAELHGEFSTTGDIGQEDRVLRHNGFFHRLENLAAGEARVYRVVG